MDIGHRGRYFRSEPVLQPAAAEPYAGRFGRLGLSGQSDSHDYANRICARSALHRTARRSVPQEKDYIDQFSPACLCLADYGDG